MNGRQRFLEVMKFNRSVGPPRWEFGCRGATVRNWYRCGLPRHRYPELIRRITTPTSSLCSTAWTCGGTGLLPSGIAVMAGGLCWPTQGFPLDHVVRRHFGIDHAQVMVDVNLLFEPMFDVRILHEHDERLVCVDIGGVRRIFLRFGALAHLMGYETLSCACHDDPGLVHDILNTFTDLWIAVCAEVLDQVEIDHLHIREDVSAGKGPMIGPAMVQAFMLPYYRRIIDFVKARGVEIIFVDTDGRCDALIPLFMSVGVTGMYPFEVHCGMDIVKVRREYPTLRILGGVPKSEIARGRRRIDEILEPVAEVLRTGGYVPFGDHFIPPDVPWEEFSCCRTRLNDLIDAVGR